MLLKKPLVCFILKLHIFDEFLYIYLCIYMNVYIYVPMCLYVLLIV